MRNYFFDARVTAQMHVTANIAVTLGVSLSLFHKSQFEKIHRWESGNEPERHHAVALLKVELAEFERWIRELEGKIEEERNLTLMDA